MKNETHTPLALGLMVILALLFSLLFVSLLQLQSTGNSMEKLVSATNTKTAAANDMRDAIRLRSASLKTLMLTRAAPERDAEYQRFTGHAEKYRVAREALAGPGMDEHESEIFRYLNQLAISAEAGSDSAASLLMNAAPADEIDAAMENAEALQQKTLAAIDELVALERAYTEHALEASRDHYSGTRQVMLALTGIALLFSLLLARTVITRVAEKNRQLAFQSAHDALTGLINRREFECRLARAIEHARTHAATHALLYIDLDQFKVINDTCGHAAGDKLLQQLSQLLLGSVRQRDTLGRLGGDEFGMLLENCPLVKAVVIANELLGAINAFQFNWGGNTFTPGASIGVVPVDHSSTDLAGIMSAADSACYIAKESGRDQVQIAHLGDRRLQQRHDEMQWVSRLTRALEEDRFTLYFQPIVPCSARQGRNKHIEILLRMIDEDGTLIAPGCFLPAGEKYKISSGIDRRVISRTMQWLASDPAHGDWPVVVSINLCAQSVGNPEMLRFIIEEKEKSGIDPGRIVFEVTETATIANITSATGFMLTLRGSGFRFALDHFGNGLSSFAYLKKLPVDFLKIDGAFVRDILSDPVDRALVRSINELGQLLGKQTVATSVDTPELVEELRRMGVDFVQGHACARPQPLEDFARVMGPRLVVVSS